LNWWGNLERQMHLTPDTVSWELFEERFQRKYLPAYYEEQQVGAFHALVQGNRTVEEYEIRFMELVKYVSYMDNDQRQAERFVYGLNPKIRAMVRMWKPSSVAEAVENARYAEEHMKLTGGTRLPFCIILDSLGRPLGHFLGEGAQGHLHMVTESHQE
jgi:hypothetical protein